MSLQGNLILPADADRETWTATRRRGIGGSDVAAIAGLSRWRTSYAVWLEKRGELPEQEVGEAAYWGTRLEHIVAIEFASRTGHAVIDPPGTLQHPEFPWMLVNVDRFVCARLDDCPDKDFDEREFAERRCDGCAILECKTTSVWNEDQWDDGELPYAALLQVHHAFAITGLKKAYVPALIGGQRFVISEVDRDDELIELVINLGAEFWRRVVENDPPEIDGEESTSRLLGQLYKADPDKIVELPDFMNEIIAQRQQASIAEKEAKKRKDQASNELKSLLGDAEVGTIAGYPVVTWKESTRDGYTVAPTTVRTLKITKRKS